MLSNLYPYIAPGSATKPIQEETKKETKEETKKPQKNTDLPLLEVEPMFEGEKMLIHDEKGSRLDAGCCVALIASLTLTVKDV